MAKLPGADQQVMNDCKDVATAYDQLGAAATRAVGPLTQKSCERGGALPYAPCFGGRCESRRDSPYGPFDSHDRWL